MQKSQKQRAISLFRRWYEKDPSDMGYAYIDIYPKQNAYLYSHSAEAITAYKKQQDILRWVIRFFPFPMVVALIIILSRILVPNLQLMTDIVFICAGIFLTCWLSLLTILAYKSFKAGKKSKDVIWLNYEH